MFGMRRSSASPAATKPESSSVSPLRLIELTDPRTQWWLVTISPVAETKAAEHPGIRSAAIRARANHAESAVKP